MRAEPPSLSAMNALLAYLTENCCGRDAVCAPVGDPAVDCSSAAPKTMAALRRDHNG